MTRQEWVSKNIERVRETWRRSYWKHRETRMQYSREYHAKHRDEQLAKRRAKYQKKKEAELLEMWNKRRAA